VIPRLVAALCLAVLLASCGGGQAETLPSDVQVVAEMRDYSITLSVPTVKAGLVKFGIRNLGGMAHQFDLIKTDLAPDKLPVDAASAKAKEDGLVKQVLNIAPGKVATVSAELQAGHYVIICNVPGHYQLKMYAELKVE
jgi:uncharacterized cupredoxin-like copper-binding protein